MILAIALFALVSRCTFFFLLIVARKNENNYHLDFLIAHIGFLIVSSFFYLLITQLSLSPKLGVVNSLCQLASLTCLFLHTKSVIEGYRSKLKVIYLLPPAIFIVVVILNSFDVYLLNLKVASSFLSSGLLDDQSFFNAYPMFWTDKVFVKQIVSLPYVLLLLFSYRAKINSSLSIINKPLYQTWLSMYMVSVLILFICISLNYYDIWNLRNNDTLMSILAINGLLLTLYFSINPAFLHSFPLIRVPVKLVFDPELSDKFEILESVMKKDRLYLSKNLLSKTVCMRIGISQPDFSKLIKAQAGKNFNQYVNDYRVQYAVSKLHEPGFLNKYSLNTLSDVCGFASSASFYRAFKLNMNMTPTSYYEAVVKANQ